MYKGYKKVFNTEIKKGFYLILADFFGLIVGLLNGFFLPAVFSIDGYALFRTFTLYATYAVIFSFGLSDGLYLLYGGKDEKAIDKSQLKSYYIFLIKLQCGIFIILFLLSYFLLKETAIIFFSIFVFPLQLINFFRLYFRAVGEFGKYSKTQASLVVLELINTLLIVFYLKSEQPNIFISIKIINHILIAVLLSVSFFVKLNGVKPAKLKWNNYLGVMKPGMIVLVADLIAALIFSLDRWFVKAFFTTEDFAYYAFAVSIMNLFIILITSVTNIYYSYISKKISDDDYLINLKKWVLLLSSFIMSSYFIFQYIVYSWLPKYIKALDILWILMLTMPLIGVINIVYINMYKASGSVKLYNKKMIVTIAISFVLNILACIVWRDMRAIALATVLTFVFWFFYSSQDFKQANINKNEILYLLFVAISFIIIHEAKLYWLLSFFIYLCVSSVNAFLFNRADIAKKLIKNE